ncbi:MAG TPA: hypothetical protein PKZ16_02290 [bacterium]|nr:hypothetical protein [bacterium]HPL95576.1 hypothetical protein [bacterium]
MIKKINFNSIVVIVFCLALAAGLFYFHNLKNNQKTCRAYLSDETRWYAEFSLKNTTWSNLNKEEKNFFYQQKIMPELEEKFWPLIDLVATVNTPEGVVWLLETKNSKKILAELPKKFKSVLLESDLVGLANNEKSLELIKKSGATPPGDVSKLITNNFLPTATLNFYFSSHQAPKISAWLPFEIGEQKKYVFLSLNKKDVFWQYELNTKIGEKKTTNSKFNSQFKNWQDEENKISKNIFLQNDGVLLIAVANLAELWPIENDFGNEFKKTINNKYPDIDINNFDKNLINGPALMLLEKKPTANSNNWLLAVQVKDAKEKINILKELLSKILAYTYPEEQIKKLPDGSTAINLVANNKKYSFQASTNGLYETTETPEGVWAVMQNGNYLLLTNKAALLDKILISEKNNQVLTILEQPPCFFATGQEFMKVNLAALELKLPNQFLSANLENNNGQLKIRGCLK